MKKYLVIALLVVFCLAFLSPVDSESKGECIRVNWIKNSIFTCYWDGYASRYNADGQLRLTGKIPTDDSWDGQMFKLNGYLVHNQYNCLMLFVTEAKSCTMRLP